jgi:hypothetical protein
MPEDGYLEEIDQTQATPVVQERPAGWVAGLAVASALLIMLVIGPFCVVWKFISRRRR